MNVSQYQFISDKCTTTKYGNGPQKGVDCIFPIKYQGKTYTGCVPYVGVASSWCSTKGMYNFFEFCFY